MKKILSMMAIAAMICGAFTACDDDDENKTENTPKQAIEATATATSVTVTVNPELLKGGAPNGYAVGVLTKDYIDLFLGEDDEMTIEDALYSSSYYTKATEENPVTIDQTLQTFFGASEAIQPGTEYYVFIGVYNEEINFTDGSDFSYITITTPAE